MKNYQFRKENLTNLYRKNKIKKINKCIVCNSSNNLTWSKTKIFPSKICKNCGLIFMSEQLVEKGLNEYYSDYIGRRRINNKLKMKQRSEQYILDRDLITKFVSKGRILDVGCNGGFFLSYFGNNFKKYGTEIDKNSVLYAKQQYPAFSKNIYFTSILNSNFKDNFFNLVIMRGVIEHLSNPKSHLKKISDLLKKDGYLYICATPNGNSPSFKIYRERWNLFHPVQHLWHFSPINLEYLCSKFSLKLVYKDFHYIGTPYEDFKNDIIKITNEIKNKTSEISPPFFENMMSLIFQKK